MLTSKVAVITTDTYGKGKGKIHLITGHEDPEEE
jgi:hypothetical protein